MSPETRRRRFLQFLAASPLLALGAREALAEIGRGDGAPNASLEALLAGAPPITRAEEALSVFDFERAARQRVSLAHFAKVATGSDDELTLRANRSDLADVRLQAKALRHVRAPNPSIEIFGMKWGSPIFICPTGGVRSMHPDGNIAVSRAAEAGRHLQMFSGAESVAFEDCIAARGGGPIWFQLYPHFFEFEVARAVAARAASKGAPVLVLTIDQPVFPNFERLTRLRRLDEQACESCHATAAGGGLTRGGTRPNHDVRAEIGVAGANPTRARSDWTKLDWDLVRRLRDTTKMKVVLKGILSAEDAALSMRYGFDGIVVSNHGGRAGDFGVSSISVLPEIVDAVDRKAPVLVDGGFRRGTDVVKALALGADAVGIGRPYLWGLGAFGQAGVARVLEMLREEAVLAMSQIGASSVNELDRSFIYRGRALR